MLNTCYRSRLPRGMIFRRTVAANSRLARVTGNGKKSALEHYHFVMPMALCFSPAKDECVG
jgi:hypothetical protein